jgi:dTDP-4-dehydrorhamnose reductase
MENKKPVVYVMGRGLVGGRLVKELEENTNFTVVSNKQAPHGSRITSTPASIDIERILADMAQTFGPPDIIVNTIGVVGKPNVDWCEDNQHETRYGNVDIPVDMAVAATKMGVPLIHISTGCIFSDVEGKTVFLPEDEPNFTDSFYSLTKADAEYQLRQFQKQVPQARIEIHRIRMVFYGEKDPRNLLDKLISYETLVDSPNSMTHLDDYSHFVADRVEAILENLPDEFEDDGWFSIQHAVNKGAISHVEVVEMLKEFGNVEFKEKKFITPTELNKMCPAPRSNCILGDEQLPDIRTSMLKAIKDYGKSKTTTKQDKK